MFQMLIEIIGDGLVRFHQVGFNKVPYESQSRHE